MWKRLIAGLLLAASVAAPAWARGDENAGGAHGYSGGGSGETPTALDITGANVTFIKCTDSIQTKVTAATAGDTIILGSCTYSVSSTITVDKALTILGQGPESTIIDSGSTDLAPIFQMTADNVTFQGMKFIGTNFGQALNFNGTAGTTLQNSVVRDVHIVATDSDSNVDCVHFTDSGGIIENFYFKVTGASDTNQDRCIRKSAASTQEAATTLVIQNGMVDLKDTNVVSGQVRALFHWGNASGALATDSTVIMKDVTLLCRPNTTGSGSTTECFQTQGPNVAPNPGTNGETINIVYGGSVDGNADAITGSSTSVKDIRCDDYARCEFYGTVFSGTPIQSSNNGTIYRYGNIYASGIEGSALTQMDQHIAARPVISLTGQQGGNKPGTGAQTGLSGADAIIVLGAGGSATAATTTGTGGPGGEWTLTLGEGSDQTIATSTTNVGGASGDYTLTGATGGDANSAGTTNTGGAGTDMTQTLGNGGAVTNVGTTNTGGRGGNFVHTAGTGGAAASGTDTGGAGGDVTWTAGTGGAGDTGGRAGNVTINAGAVGSGGSPVVGTITLGATGKESIALDPSTTSNAIGISSATGVTNIALTGIGITSTVNDMGWSVVDQTDNQACTTGCTFSCLFGIENATGTAVTNIVSCAGTTADLCMCAGAN